MRTFHRLGAVSSLVLAGLSPSAQALDLPFARVASYNPTTPTTQGPATTLRVLERTYDGIDRLKTETVQLEDGTTAQLIYTHWRNGVRKTLTDAAGRVTFYEYDGRNRLERLTTNQGRADEQITTYDYWPDSLLKTVTKPDGTVTSYDYDRADRLTSVVVRKDGTEILSYAYTYDPNGNRQTQVETNGGPPETTTYGYDALDRLETVTYPDGRTVTYGYDAVGNRASEAERDASSVVLSRKTAVFDAANRLSTVTDAVNPANNATFTFDPNGNLTAKTTAAGTETYAFDHRDQLVETAKDERVTARFAYDAFGRRYLKIGDEGLRQYLYDETSLLQEYSQPGVEVAKYDWGGDRLVSLFRVEELRQYFHFDALGSVVALTDKQGNVAARYHYDAWGGYREPAELDTSTNRFGFTGHIYDRETSLYFAKARYFDPEFGRFLTQDSSLGRIDEPPSLHRYVYVWNRPTFWVDRTGHAPGDWWDPRSYEWDVVGAGLLVGAIRGGDVAVGFSEAITNNFLGLPRNETPNPDRRAGQIAGDFLSVPAGSFEATAGGGAALTGGTLTVATVGASGPITIPASLVGLAAVAHGTYASTNAAEHLRTNLDERRSEALGGDGKAKIAKESASGDAASPEPSQKPDSGTVPTTEQAVPNAPSTEPKKVYVDPTRYPETAGHIRDAQAAGQPRVLTVERSGASPRRRASRRTNTEEPRPQTDIDEYPFASTSEGGSGASTRRVPSGDNRGAGACYGCDIRDVPNGGAIEVIPEAPPKPQPSPKPGAPPKE